MSGTQNGDRFIFLDFDEPDSTCEGDWNMSDSKKAERGSVVSLWRYPVKSMMGEELKTA
jgi:hypothetical protein